MKTLIIQNVSTKEIRTVIQAVYLSDKDEYKVIRTDIQDLEKYKDVLETAIPIGSVEFVRKAMEIAWIMEPYIDPYPGYHELLISGVNDLFSRDIYLDKVCKKNIQNFVGKFVKPTRLKQFNGFVYTDQDPIDEFTKEQKSIFESLVNDHVWVSDVVNFISEFRYYIRDHKIIGYARYDENEQEDVPEPDITVIENYISVLSKCNFNFPYALDFGVLDNNKTALVEFTDFWAIGLYGHALKPKEYLEMLIERYEDIRHKGSMYSLDSF